jgi:predicted DsbA family dithiol-disulfide isomerase
MSALTIDFVSDVICPWCFIGFTRLEQALAQAGEGAAEITLRPFQLDPTTPPEGADLRERLAKKYGSTPRRCSDESRPRRARAVSRSTSPRCVARPTR